jgi:hypothetical protein
MPVIGLGKTSTRPKRTQPLQTSSRVTKKGELHAKLLLSSALRQSSASRSLACTASKFFSWLVEIQHESAPIVE